MPFPSSTSTHAQGNRIREPHSWPGLNAFRLSWKVRLDEDCTLPQWKGSMMRGILGWGLDRAARGAPSPGWPGLVAGSALARTMLDPQGAWSDQMAVAPWSLQCPDGRTRFTAGDILAGTFVLHGDWPDWCRAMLHEAFSNGVAGGLGADRIQGSMIAWDGQNLRYALAPQATGCIIATTTPCRLQDRQEDCRSLRPAALGRSLLRRWRQLHRQTTGSDPLSGEAYQVLSHRCDDLVELAGMHLPIRLERFSSRQDHEHPINAVQGWVRIAGPGFADLAPFLALAEHFHVGRQPCFGLGQVAVGWDLSDVERQSGRGVQL